MNAGGSAVLAALLLVAAGMEVGLILAGGKAQWIGLVILLGAYPLTVVGPCAVRGCLPQTVEWMLDVHGARRGCSTCRLR